MEPSDTINHPKPMPPPPPLRFEVPGSPPSLPRPPLPYRPIVPIESFDPTGIISLRSLADLITKYGSDKALHRYVPIYERLFADRRLSVKSVLEIGVDFGNSLRAWADYFPNAEIHGIDIHKRCLEYQTDRIKVHLGEQGDVNFLGKTVSPSGPFDVIIDDGSHASHDQIVSFQHLFEYALADGGIYVIEDLHDAAHYGLHCRGNPDVKPEQHPGKHAALDYLKQLVDRVNYCPAGDWNPSKWADDNQPARTFMERHVTSIEFFRFFTVIHKGNNEASSR